MWFSFFIGCGGALNRWTGRAAPIATFVPAYLDVEQIASFILWLQLCIFYNEARILRVIEHQCYLWFKKSEIFYITLPEPKEMKWMFCKTTFHHKTSICFTEQESNSWLLIIQILLYSSADRHRWSVSFLSKITNMERLRSLNHLW